MSIFTPCVKMELDRSDFSGRLCRKMEARFLCDELDRLETDVLFDGGFPQAVVRAFRKRMQTIRAATDERIFYELKSLHYEKLKGDLAGFHSMRLNDQWRLVFRLDPGEHGKVVVIVEIADYH